MSHLTKHLIFSALLFFSTEVFSQSIKTSEKLWHNKERYISYKPDGSDFVRVNGKRRFNRALYGTNTGFRVETGDLPEFALYLPGMGGNMKFGIISGTKSKWIIDAKSIETRFSPGSMHYTIKDSLLGSGVMHISVLAEADAEGMIIKVNFKGVPNGVELFWAYGGVSGKKFIRDGDIGRDPESSFYLKPENCIDNYISLNKNSFTLNFGTGKPLTTDQIDEMLNWNFTKDKKDFINQKYIKGVFPIASKLNIAGAEKQESPLSLSSSKLNKTPVLVGKVNANTSNDLFFLVQVQTSESEIKYSYLPEIFNQAEKERLKLANRIKVNTPDPYINTLGGALAVAADAIWESPSYLHGAIAWRTQLNGWRGAAVADPLGWHERAKLHLESYKNSQVLYPAVGAIIPDTVRNYARQLEEIGTAVFSSGYISSKPNNNSLALHYDMNLVFFDLMLRHFNWNGDLRFIEKMWPAVKLHLAWEKRNFDMDGDGLYDAYAAIWASDALQYSGGGVTHSSAYNYKANKMAAKLAKLLKEDPTPFQQEADKILKAINNNLWLKDKGWYAEYKDLLGLKLVHPHAALWTIYHTIDSEVPDLFQAYQALRYIDTEIPHIPIKAKGIPDKNYYTISTTNWQPYTWSLNNVATAEVLHTALAYWQGGRSEEAYKLWESIIIENLYLSNSPGGFKMLSFYDAIIGEFYRDFADPTGMVARTLVEGLFGINPDALSDTLTIQPGLPQAWNYASLTVPDLSFDYKRTANIDRYKIGSNFSKQMNLRLILKASADKLKSVYVNGKKASWKILEESVGSPSLEIYFGKSSTYDVVIEWDGKKPFSLENEKVISSKSYKKDFHPGTVLELFDPQNVLQKKIIKETTIEGIVNKNTGHKTVFAKLKQGDFTWWAPVNLEVIQQIQLFAEQEQTGDSLLVKIKNNSEEINGNLTLNNQSNTYLNLPANSSKDFKLPSLAIAPGTNIVSFKSSNGLHIEREITNWATNTTINANWQKIDLSAKFNDKVTNIFKNKYLAPRPTSPTLQIPTQGIGNWCYPFISVDIDDAGLRAAASAKNEIKLPNGIPLMTPGELNSKNIIFTSKWDNYPDSVNIPLNGKASHAYLMMAGSTNPMQSQIDNGEVIFYYTDGTAERLALNNPEKWWPIEQDYYVDDFAFKLKSPRPYRVKLKTAEISRTFKKFYVIPGFSNFGIDGGAATVLDIPLNPYKELKEIKLKVLANEVIIGLMSLTLKR
jgi:hypothetical protein